LLCVIDCVIFPWEYRRDISKISSLTLNSNRSPQGRAHTIVKLKNLRKKVRRLEKWLQEGAKKLARLRQKLQAAQAAKAMKASGKPAARATATRLAPKPSTPIEKKSPTQTSKKPRASKKAKRKLNLSPERRAQLAAAKRAAEASATPASADDQHSAADSTPQAPELASPLAAVPMPPEAARLTEPSDEEIRLRAYFISEHRRRCALPGDADSDWREAKQQLLSKSGELSGRSQK
jgi:hypothetical protein